jgi:hypothetical protein
MCTPAVSRETNECIIPHKTRSWIKKPIRNGDSFISRHINRREAQEIIQIKLLSSDIFYSERGVSCEAS